MMKPISQTRDQPQRSFLNTGEPKGGGGSRSIHQPTVAVPSASISAVESGTGQRYKGIGDAVLRITREEGLAAFFKGASCRVLVIAPLFGIAQTVYYLGVGEYILGASSTP